MEKANYVTKKSLKDTLLIMGIGSQIEIKNSDFKEMSVRSTCCRLKKQGYYFDVSGANRIDDVIVTRLK